MIKIEHVESLDSAELQPYRTLRRSQDHVKQGIFVAEGEKVVRRLLETEIEVVSMLLSEKWLEEIRPLVTKALDNDVRIWVAPKQVLESIVGFNLHQGIMAVGKIPRHRTLEQFISTAPNPHLIVALDGLTNTDNIGVIVRNCVAFGVDALIIPRNTSDPYLRRAVRMSMGTVFDLPVVSIKNLVESLRNISAQLQTRIIAAQPSGNVSSIVRTDLRENICIVLGSEGSGISPGVLETCSERVSITLESKVDSLNVASASAVLLFEAKRQRERSLEFAHVKG